MQGYSIRAKDGELGSVKVVYFTDLSWNVHYVVVDTGHWLPGRKVLLSTAVLQQLEPAASFNTGNHKSNAEPVLSMSTSSACMDY
jgi:hypothetical protein